MTRPSIHTADTTVKNYQPNDNVFIVFLTHSKFRTLSLTLSKYERRKFKKKCLKPGYGFISFPNVLNNMRTVHKNIFLQIE